MKLPYPFHIHVSSKSQSRAATCRTGHGESATGAAPEIVRLFGVAAVSMGDLT